MVYDKDMVTSEDLSCILHKHSKKVMKMRREGMCGSWTPLWLQIWLRLILSVGKDDGPRRGSECCKTL